MNSRLLLRCSWFVGRPSVLARRTPEATVVGVLFSMTATGCRQLAREPSSWNLGLYGLGVPVSSPCQKKSHLGHSRITEVPNVDVSRRCLMKVKQDGQMTRVGRGAVGGGSGMWIRKGKEFPVGTVGTT